MNFGGRIRELRQAKGLTLRALGERTGTDYVVINKIALELRKPPPLEDIFALADALDADAEELIRLAKERFEPKTIERLLRSRSAQVLFTRRAPSLSRGGQDGERRVQGAEE